MTVSTISSSHQASDIDQLREWFKSQWGTVDPIFASNCPPPILGKENHRLVGGLSFTQAQRPKSQVQAIWINALYVEPYSRGKGIARLLVQRAETLAIESQLEELYVFTKIPQLYLSLDWEALSEDENGHVLRKGLRSDA